MGFFDAIGSALGDVVSFVPNMIGAIGSTVVGNKNVEAQEKANERNVALQKETNAQNYQMFRESQDFSREMYQRQLSDQWDMWNAQNEYNSASSQRRRLEAAGLNPYMMMSGGNAGTGSSMSAPSASSPSYSPAQAPRVNPVLRDFMGGFQLSNLAESFLRIQDQKADVQGKNIDNQYRSAKNALDLAQRIANIRGMNENTKGKAIQNLFDGASFNSRLAAVSMQPQFMQQQIRALELQNMAAEAKLPYISKYAQAELDYIVAQTRNLDRKTDAEISKLYSEAYLNNAKRLNLPYLSESQRIELGRMMVLSARASAGLSQNELFWSNRDRSIFEENSKEVPGFEKFLQQGEYVVGGFGRTLSGLGLFMKHLK